MENIRHHLKGYTTMINVTPSENFLVIDAWNKHCRIRVAEKNSRIIYRLLKTSFKLYWRTFRKLFLTSNKSR